MTIQTTRILTRSISFHFILLNLSKHSLNGRLPKWIYKIKNKKKSGLMKSI